MAWIRERAKAQEEKQKLVMEEGMHDEMLKGGFSWRVLNIRIGWCVFSGREVESIGHHILLLCNAQRPKTRRQRL